MGDKTPLYFTARLGGLFPANAAAEEAMKEITGTVRAVLTGGKANQRRRSLYWVLVGIVTPILNDMHSMTLTDDDLHDIIEAGPNFYAITEIVVKPSGRVPPRTVEMDERKDRP